MALIDWEILAYNFDTDGSCPDLVWSNDWTINGATFEDWWGIINSCYSFVTNDYITHPWDVSFIQNTAEFTVNIWVKLDDYTKNAFQIFYTNTYSSWSHKGFYMAYDNRSGVATKALKVVVTRWSAPTTLILFYENAILNNNWHMVTATSGWTTGRLYVDGVEKTTASVGTLSTGASSYSTAYLWSAQNLSFFFDGRLDALYLKDEYSDLTDVTELYASGAGNQYPFITKYTITLSDSTILLDGTSNPVTATLPTAVWNTWQIFTVKSINIDYVCKLATNWTETIDWESDIEFALYESKKIQSNGTNRFIL